MVAISLINSYKWCITWHFCTTISLFMAEAGCERWFLLLQLFLDLYCRLVMQEKQTNQCRQSVECGWVDLCHGIFLHPKGAHIAVINFPWISTTFNVFCEVKLVKKIMIFYYSEKDYFIWCWYIKCNRANHDLKQDVKIYKVLILGLI